MSEELEIVIPAKDWHRARTVTIPYLRPWGEWQNIGYVEVLLHPNAMSQRVEVPEIGWVMLQRGMTWEDEVAEILR